MLCKFFESEVHFRQRFWAGRKVIELGAGLGLPSLAAALLGAAEVLITDLAEALELPRKNIALNFKDEQANISVAALDWNDAAKGHTSLPADWDIIICTDILFVPEAIPPLVQTIAVLSGPHTRVLSCCEHRFEEATQFYEMMRAAGFRVDRVPNEELHELYRGDAFHVYWFVPSMLQARDT